MNRLFGLLFAVAAFVAVHLVFAYLVFWLAGFWLKQSVSSAARMSTGPAFVIDCVLLLLFGLQHSGMARKTFKRMTAVLPEGLQRTAYVCCAVICLLLLVHFYQPIPTVIWHVDGPAAQLLIGCIAGVGWMIAAAAYVSVGIFYLLGVSQALAWYQRRPQPPQPLVEGYAYRFVRNPQQLGLLLAFWATPNMTIGHLVFAGGMTTYIFLGMALEERDLMDAHGESFKAYKMRVPSLIPKLPSLGHK